MTGDEAQRLRSGVANLTQPQLAELFGVHVQTIKRQEKSAKVSRLYEIAMAWLTHGEQPPEPEPTIFKNPEMWTTINIGDGKTITRINELHPRYAEFKAKNEAEAAAAQAAYIASQTALERWGNARLLDRRAAYDLAMTTKDPILLEVTPEDLDIVKYRYRQAGDPWPYET